MAGDTDLDLADLLAGWLAGLLTDLLAGLLTDLLAGLWILEDRDGRATLAGEVGGWKTSSPSIAVKAVFFFASLFHFLRTHSVIKIFSDQFCHMQRSGECEQPQRGTSFYTEKSNRIIHLLENLLLFDKYYQQNLGLSDKLSTLQT